MHSYRRDLTLLRDRRFALLLAARTVSVFGGSCAPVALAFGVLELPGAKASTLSIVLAANAVPMVVFMLFGGVIGDRLPRQRVMMTGETMNAVSYLAIAAMLGTGWAPLPALATAAAVSGVGMAVFWPALVGIVPDIVPTERLQAANGLIGLGVNISRIGGMVAGGAMVTLLGASWALGTTGAFFALAAILIAALGRTRAPGMADAAKQSVLKELREGWQVFSSKQWLWVVVAQFSLLVMALQAAHGVLGPVVAKQDLGGAKAWTAVLVAEAVGMLAGVVIAMRLRPQRPILLATLMIFPAAIPYALLGASAPLWTVVVGAFILGVCFDIFGVLWNTTMQREIPPDALSRVSSYDALGSLMFGPIGLLAAGPLSDAIGAKPALIWCSVLIIAVTLAALAAPGVRNLRARPSEDAEAHLVTSPLAPDDIAGLERL